MARPFRRRASPDSRVRGLAELRLVCSLAHRLQALRFDAELTLARNFEKHVQVWAACRSDAVRHLRSKRSPREEPLHGMPDCRGPLLKGPKTFTAIRMAEWTP